MKVAANLLTGNALDYAVALLEYPEWRDDGYLECPEDLLFDDGHRYSPSTNGTQGIVIIDRERIRLTPFPPGREAEGWNAGIYDKTMSIQGSTSLVAAMRCYVISKLGDQVEIPHAFLV